MVGRCNARIPNQIPPQGLSEPSPLKLCAIQTHWQVKLHSETYIISTHVNIFLWFCVMYPATCCFAQFILCCCCWLWEGKPAMVPRSLEHLILLLCLLRFQQADFYCERAQNLLLKMEAEVSNKITFSLPHILHFPPAIYRLSDTGKVLH